MGENLGTQREQSHAREGGTHHLPPARWGLGWVDDAVLGVEDKPCTLLLEWRQVLEVHRWLVR